MQKLTEPDRISSEEKSIGTGKTAKRPARGKAGTTVMHAPGTDGSGVKKAPRDRHNDQKMLWLLKWFRKDNLIVILLLGVLLVVIAWPVKDTGKTAEDPGLGSSDRYDSTGFYVPSKSNGYPWNTNLSSGAAQEATAGTYGTAYPYETYQNTDAYISDMEQRLTSLLSGMKGVGKVRVMITLESTQELVVEKEQKTSLDQTVEQDSQGGSRNIYKQQTDQEAIYHTDGKQEPYVIMTYLPKVEGVVILAQGAGTGDVNSSITDAVMALFGIGAHKVKVLKMSDQ